MEGPVTSSSCTKHADEEAEVEGDVIIAQLDDYFQAGMAGAGAGATTSAHDQQQQQQQGSTLGSSAQAHKAGALDQAATAATAASSDPSLASRDTAGRSKVRPGWVTAQHGRGGPGVWGGSGGGPGGWVGGWVGVGGGPGGCGGVVVGDQVGVCGVEGWGGD